jgi:hypothetical protein
MALFLKLIRFRRGILNAAGSPTSDPGAPGFTPTIHILGF